MGMLSSPAFGPRTAIIYVTVGALMDVWTAVWYFVYIRGRTTPVSPNEWFWLSGLFLTGFTLMAIGMLLGPIGRSARRAELPPTEVTGAEARIQQTAAAVPDPIIAPGMGAVGGVAATIPNPAILTPTIPNPALGSALPSR